MKIAKIFLIILLIDSFFELTLCSAQKYYFQPEGIIDRTGELNEENRWTSLKNKESIDGYTRIDDAIFGGEIACNVMPLKNIDIKTFKVLPGTKFAKDKKHLYYPFSLSCDDFEDCGVCYFSKVIVEGANPATFRSLGKNYFTDGNLVFFGGEQIAGASSSTFKVIEGPYNFFFAVDQFHVYQGNNFFNEADPSSFYFDNDNPRNMVDDTYYIYIIGDKNSKWRVTNSNKIELIEK